MQYSILNRTFIIAIVFNAALLVWRLAFPYTDWAVSILLILAAVLLWANWRKNIAIFRLWKSAAIVPSSTLNSILTGKFQATILSIFFVIFALPILAYHTISGSNIEIAATAVLSLFSAASFLTSEHFLLKTFKATFCTVCCCFDRNMASLYTIYPHLGLD